MLDQATAHVPVNLPVNAVGVPNGKVVRPPFQVPIRLSNQARDRLKAPRAAPNHPGRPSGCLPVASPPVSGFILVGGLATSIFLSRPNRVYFTLRLACFAHTNASPDGLLHPALAGLHVRTGNLHGELLSVHKISLKGWSSGVAVSARGSSNHPDFTWSGPPVRPSHVSNGADGQNRNRKLA